MKSRCARPAIALRVLAAIGVAWSMAACAQTPVTPRRQPPTRVVVLGFDGMDPTLAGRWMADGSLPNLKRLAADGTFTTLQSPPPAESPVAWCSFATGTNPGKHNVYDFLERAPEAYAPVSNLYKTHPQEFFMGLIAKGPATVEPRRGGIPFWVDAGKSGIRTAVLTVPMTYPPDDIDQGRMLAGFPAPDVRGTAGTYHYWATDLSLYQEQGFNAGVAKRLSFANDAAMTEIEGLHSPIDGSPVTAPMSIGWDRSNKSISVDLGGASVRLTEGAWSDWVPVSFRITPLEHVHGVLQFHLIAAGTELKLFSTPINIDPRYASPTPLSTPAGYASDLARRLGVYRTVGWAEFADKALQAGVVDEAVFLQDANHAFDDRERLILDSIKTDPWDLFIAVIETTDRVSHMMWRLTDPTHPMYDAALAAKYGDAIQRIYERADDLVGKVRALLPPDVVLIVMSDHGFHSFRRSVNLNTWLVQHGYMTLGGTDATGAGFQGVDWSKTKAYALGLGQIYLNLEGRESRGIVTPGKEAQALTDQIRRELVTLRDPKDDRQVLLNVYAGAEIYHGPYIDNAPDLVVGFSDGYRVGFFDAQGGLSRAVIENNDERWSGDHCGSASTISGGVLFVNRPVVRPEPGIVDMAPTIFQLLGMPLRPDFDGTPFLAPAVQAARTER